MKKRVKLTSKSQASLDFLTAYGWAIMLVLVAIGGLAYFGVLSPDKFIPRKCLIEAGIGCMDFKVQEDSVTLVLRNGKSENIDITQIVVGSCSASNLGILKNDEQKTFAVGSCTNIPDKKFIGEVNITYVTETGFLHKKRGSLIDRVESGCGLCACLNIDTSCGNYPSCNNCNNLDGTSGSNYCQGNDVYINYDNYGCSNQQCTPTTAPQLVQLCTNGNCQGGSCACNGTDINCGTYSNCAACGANQACQNNQCVTQTCADGTIINTCSSAKPLYCNSGLQLVNSCSQCSCPSGQICQGDGSCGACGNIDTNCGTYPNCNNCDSQDTYLANYCFNNNVYRDFRNYSCSSQACNPATTPELVQNCVSNNGICQSNQCVCANTASSCGTFPSCAACGANQACQSSVCIWNLNGVWGANFIYGYKRTNFIQNGNNVHDSLIDSMPGYPVGSETINIVITGNTFSGIAHSTIGDKVYQGTIENSGTTLNGIFDPGGFNADFDYNKE